MKGAGVVGGKTPTVYGSERQRQNGGSNGSVYVSHKGVPNKEAVHAAYQTRDHWSGDGVLTGRIGHGISVADRGSSDGWHPPWRGGKGGNYHKEKVKQKGYHEVNTTHCWYLQIMLYFQLCLLTLAVPCWVFMHYEFPAKYKNWETREIIMECTSYIYINITNINMVKLQP